MPIQGPGYPTSSPEPAKPKDSQSFTLIKSYRDFWVKSFAFGGKTKRIDYWLCVAGQIIVLFVLLMIGVVFVSFFPGATEEGILILFTSPLIVYTFFGLIPNISLHVRRLRDAGFSPWLILLLLIPYAGNFVIFIFTLQPSKNKT